MSIKFMSKPLIIVVATSAVAAGLGGYVWKEEHRPKVLEIYVFALKSGRSMFIRTPEDKRILIDGGANSDTVRELTKIVPFYSRRIDTLISTNTDGKNITGLIDVLDRYIVDKAYMPALTLEKLGLASTSDPIYMTYLDSLSEKKITVQELKTGDVINLDKNVTIKTLFPVSAESFEYSKTSAPELLFTISYNLTSVSFLGNSSKKIQKYIASATSSEPNHSDVLIVSHTAVPDSMSAELLDKLSPKFLVYSKTVIKALPRPARSSIAISKPQKSKNSSAVSKKKEITDPFEGLLDENRFNLKDGGTVKITSDGSDVQVLRSD